MLTGALVLLREANVIGSEEEAKGARTVLTAAALTTVAAFITSVLQFLYDLGVVNPGKPPHLHEQS